MDNIISDLLLKTLMVSIVLSSVIMVIIQRLKIISFLDNNIMIVIMNFIFSFSLAIPFSMTFYNFDLKQSLWVGLFTFIGAPTLYDTLKNKTFLDKKDNETQDE